MRKLLIALGYRPLAPEHGPPQKKWSTLVRDAKGLLCTVQVKREARKAV